MRGSIVKRGAGYSYVLYLGRDITGRKRQKWVGGFRTKREAEVAMVEALGRLNSGQFVDPGRLTVGEFLEQWIEAVASGLRESTAASYRMVFTRRVVPRIGELRLASLTPGHLTTMYAQLLAEGGRSGQPLSPRSVRYTHTIAGRALADAVEWGLLPRNPARAAKPPRAVKSDMAVWDAVQARQFLAFVRDDRLYAMWLLMLTTGLRRGEIAGLRWSDVDLDAAVMAIQYTRVSVNSRLVVVEPKTATGRRSVALDDMTVQALRSSRRARLEERLKLGSAWQDSGFVFVREDGAPYHPERIIVMFKRQTRAAGLPVIRLHDLRHTSATLALAAGVHPKVVQERLGHSSINITLDTYSHVVKGLQHEAAEKVAALLVD
jgi:integrase